MNEETSMKKSLEGHEDYEERNKCHRGIGHIILAFILVFSSSNIIWPYF